MAQLERTQRSSSSESPKTPRAQTSPTFEQLLRVEDAQWTPSFGMTYDQEEYVSSTNHNKKSVLTKVKERAKKLRHTLSGKKKQGIDVNEENSTPSWGVNLMDDDNDDDDPEFLGAPMYESESAPQNYIENARQHPRAIPVVSEKHALPVPTNARCEAENKENDKNFSPNKTLSETVSEKLAPAYAAVSDATHTIASKIAGLTISTPEAQQAEISSAAHTSVPLHADYDAMKLKEYSGNLNQSVGSPQRWDKGVSVKEYFLNKLEPGEDERALSQAITQAISPRKSATGDIGVVEKVKEAVTSLFWHEEEPSSNSMAKDASSNSSSHLVSTDIPISTPQNRVSLNNPRFSVEEPSEENLGRILQAN